MAKPQFNPKRLLIVHAHPDDESLYTGHIIADRIAAKAEVMVLTLTRGERGKVKLEELKPLEGNLAAMGAFRRTELIEALKAFGPVKHAFAGTRAYLDSGMRINTFGKPIKPKNLDELALSAASNSVIADDVVKAILEFKPDAVLTYNRRGGFGHPDHKKAYEASAMAVREVGRRTKHAPKFWVIAEPREKFDVEIGDAKTAVIKKAALEAHASQVAVGAETYSVVPGKEVRYDRPERVRLAQPSSIAQLKPFFTFFWALPLGVIFGLFGTLIHLVRANDDAATPIGLIVALAMTGSAAIALRLLRGSRGALYVFSGALTATVFWMAQRQIGGEVFLPNELLSNIWAYGSIGVCALVIIFPKIQAGAWRRSSRGHR
jgi:N-acetyl-1-D-myo-inositol-2-amino-2-deoxy-alpha-D-glucopyranoside deacetylase